MITETILEVLAELQVMLAVLIEALQEFFYALGF
jgi:hypothetical protein